MVVVIIVIINEKNDNSKYSRSEETPCHSHDVFKLKQGLARLRATHMMVSIRALCIPTEPANCFFSAYTVDSPPAYGIIRYASEKMQGNNWYEILPVPYSNNGAILRCYDHNWRNLCRCCFHQLRNDEGS